VSGQSVVGRECAWCGAPAVGEVEVQPARYRMLGRVDPVIGDRRAYRQLVRGAIVAPACDEHRHITRGQAPPVWTRREQRVRGEVDQLDLFATGQEAQLRNAIYGEARR
jgi:hypothetical protein